MELRQFAEQVLFGATIEEKLWTPPAITDERPGIAVSAPRMPGRPRDLAFKPSGRQSAAVPRLDRLDEERHRGRLLHFFANHELLATELMALVLLRFPKAPSAFRLGVLRTLQEEQSHAKLYLERMRQCGVRFGELPVSGFFWRAVSSMESPADYVAGLSLTFEQANLDYCRQFAEGFARSGDRVTAQLLDRIYRDEIRHVAYGLKWFRRWKAPGFSDWNAYCRQLKFPLSPRRAKGVAFNVEGRRLAGLDPEFIQELQVCSRSKGRTPTVHLFNPFAESFWCRGRRFQPGRAQAQLAADLANLPQYWAAQDDIVLVPRKPSSTFLRAIQEAGFSLPEFLELDPRRGFPPGHPLLGRKLGGVRPWAWSPDSAAVLEPILGQVTGGPVPCAGSCPPALARMYSKAWSVEFLRRMLDQGEQAWWLCPPNRVGQIATSLEAALEVIRRVRAEGHHRLVVKESYGLAGRSMIRLWEPKLLEAQRRWMERALASGYPLIVEPWLERAFDFSAQFEMGSSGLKCLGYTALFTDHAGRFQANSAHPSYRRQVPGLWAALFPGARGIMSQVRSWYEPVRSTLEKELRTMGYVGPLGVDAFVYGERDGTYRVKPIVEINPRGTMGRLALELMRYVCPGRTGTLRMIHDAAKRSSGAEHLQAWVSQLQSRNPIRLEGHPKPRISEGVLCLNDPAGARACLALFQVEKPGVASSADGLPKA